MMLGIKRVFLLTIGLLLSCATQAAVITNEFTGTITEVYRGYKPDPLVALIEVGMPFFGSYTFDTSQFQLPITSEIASYAVPPYRYSVTVGPVTAELSAGHFSFYVRDATTADPGDYWFVDGYGMFSSWTARLALVLNGYGTPNAIDGSTDLFWNPPNPLDFFEHFFAIVGETDFGEGVIRGNVETLRRVPEPLSLGLIALGMVGLAGFRRRGK